MRIVFGCIFEFTSLRSEYCFAFSLSTKEVLITKNWRVLQAHPFVHTWMFSSFSPFGPSLKKSRSGNQCNQHPIRNQRKPYALFLVKILHFSTTTKTSMSGFCFHSEWKYCRHAQSNCFISKTSQKDFDPDSND